MSARRPLARIALAGALVIGAPSHVRYATAAAATAPASALPERLTPAEFWKLTTDISEPDGYFRIEDNYTSNEREVGELFTALRDSAVTGDVYIGVGPEQNFTYIASIRPRVAFIIDIRRQAAMQHLMFKALFEMAKDRVEFVSLLFSRRPLQAPDTSANVARIWSEFYSAPADSALHEQTKTRILDRLRKTHGFVLTEDEVQRLTAVYDAFYRFGPDIATRGFRGGRGGGETFASLTSATDGAGEVRSFLSNEDNFRYIKSMHERNVIVPVTGDFAGPKALRGIGHWIRQQRGVVRAFYVSNVEQYLFQAGTHRAFYENVSTLPLDAKSVFIRPYSLRRGIAMPRPLCRIQAFLLANMQGRVYSNNAALACSV